MNCERERCFELVFVCVILHRTQCVYYFNFYPQLFFSCFDFQFNFSLSHHCVLNKYLCCIHFSIEFCLHFYFHLNDSWFLFKRKSRVKSQTCLLSLEWIFRLLNKIVHFQIRNFLFLSLNANFHFVFFETTKIE